MWEKVVGSSSSTRQHLQYTLILNEVLQNFDIETMMNLVLDDIREFISTLRCRVSIGARINDGPPHTITVDEPLSSITAGLLAEHIRIIDWTLSHKLTLSFCLGISYF
ncbi:UNVERIFIED_CONTAM: hypothetical protein RMT77_014726 [Armadillidium vulgare]